MRAGAFKLNLSDISCYLPSTSQPCRALCKDRSKCEDFAHPQDFALRPVVLLATRGSTTVSQPCGKWHSKKILLWAENIPLLHPTAISVSPLEDFPCLWLAEPLNGVLGFSPRWGVHWSLFTKRTEKSCSDTQYLGPLHWKPHSLLPSHWGQPHGWSSTCLFVYLMSNYHFRAHVGNFRFLLQKGTQTHTCVDVYTHFLPGSLSRGVALNAPLRSTDHQMETAGGTSARASGPIPMHHCVPFKKKVVCISTSISHLDWTIYPASPFSPSLYSVFFSYSEFSATNLLGFEFCSV